MAKTSKMIAISSKLRASSEVYFLKCCLPSGQQAYAVAVILSKSSGCRVQTPDVVAATTRQHQSKEPHRRPLRPCSVSADLSRPSLPRRAQPGLSRPRLAPAGPGWLGKAPQLLCLQSAAGQVFLWLRKRLSFGLVLCGI